MRPVIKKWEGMERPKCVTDEPLSYLDDLCDRGIVSMFGAVPYIELKFKTPTIESLEILVYWMETSSRDWWKKRVKW